MTPDAQDRFYIQVLDETRRQTESIQAMRIETSRYMDLLERILKLLEQRTEVIMDIQRRVIGFNEIKDEGVEQVLKGVNDLVYRNFAWKLGLAVMVGIALGSTMGDVAGPLLRRWLGL